MSHISHMHPPTQPTTDAKEPFHSSAKADIILRSSESVDFFVLKTFLSFASPVLYDMMSLNRGEAVKDNEARNGLQIIHLQEDSETMYNLLLLVYPFVERQIDDFGMHLKIARAARKYRMDEVEEKVKKQLTTSEETERRPVRPFAIAMSIGWNEEAKAVARKMLTKPLKDLVVHEDELNLIPATDYQALCRWRLDCHRAVVDFLRSKNAQSDEFVGYFKLKRKFLADALLDRLQETDCLHSSVIMDGGTMVKVLDNVDGHVDPMGRCNKISSDNIDQAQEAMLKVCQSMAKQIDNIVSAVSTISQSTKLSPTCDHIQFPFDIGGEATLNELPWYTK
ncbi:hypothetical protein APHAL10511_005234 [Amanita phalloides]|nr:hypothetical protein APHAL10511_005234 [Amanita phalloides]